MRAKLLIAFLPTVLVLPRMNIAAAIAVNKRANDPAVSIAGSTSNAVITPRITASKATTPTNGASFPTSLSVPFSKLAAAVISANAIITAVNASAEVSSASVSTNESATNDAAKTATAADNATIEPTLAVAPFADLTIRATRADSIPTAMSPLARLFISTMPSNTAIPASMPIATAIAMSIPANLAFLPENAAATPTRAETINPRTTTPMTPFFNSSHSIPAINFITIANTNIAVAIANNIVPSFGAAFPPSFVIRTKARMNAVKAISPTRPLPISSHSIPAISLMTTTMINNAADIERNICPTLTAFFPASVETATKAAKNAPSNPITIKPLVRSRVLMLAISLITPMSIKSAIEILSKDLPSPPTF